MEKVAEHINEMQRIHEEYGAIFDHLFRQHQKSCKQVSIFFSFLLTILHITRLPCDSYIDLFIDDGNQLSP